MFVCVIDVQIRDNTRPYFLGSVGYFGNRTRLRFL